MHLFAQSMETSEPVRTALYGEHLKLNGNIVDFHGFELPIWYTSITQEHLACRRESGVFDVSHMGVFRFSGHGVKQWLEGLASQQVTAIKSGRCAYTHFMDESGCIIDDMIFAVTSDDEILGVPNASMIEVMKDWFLMRISQKELHWKIFHLNTALSRYRALLQRMSAKRYLEKKITWDVSDGSHYRRMN